MPMIGGRYRLIAEVGTGGTASVWRAVDVRLERTAAVRMLPHRIDAPPPTDFTVNGIACDRSVSVLAVDRADTA
ncbi:hypothetical protein [Dactylosporangium sp. NPDC000521]|uniref:hypothetical protein n=1 Tax=Dactylosporangium sp. NPDC000521 TaxID=3363975 RepID=UPI00367E761A